MEKIAEVFVNIPVKSIAKAYSYRIPAGLSFVDVGWRVLVPFGRRKVEGFVVAVQKGGAAVEKTDVPLKDIERAVDEEAWFTPDMLKLAKWLSDFYLCSFAEMMRLFMPGKSGLKIAVHYAALKEKEGNAAILAMRDCRAVYQLLVRKGALKSHALKKTLPAVDVDAALEKLIRYKLVRREYEASKRETAKYETYVVRKKEITEATKADFKRKRSQKKLLCYMEGREEASIKELKEAGFSRPVIRQVADAGILQMEARRVLRDSYRKAAGRSTKRLVLTEAQKRAITAMEASLAAHSYAGFLLKGVTGSGKTQVYIEMARRVRQAGRKVMVLVPEIALTGQIVLAFKAYFSEDIVVFHSNLSLAERNDAVLRVRCGEAGIIIGARSALFTPADVIGLIILDEEQDMSYKQDASPRYHARIVAEKMAKMHGAILLLGSATPSMESYARTKSGKLTLLTMPKRIGNMPLPSVQCVDMREELRLGNRHILSRALQALIEKTTAQGRQVIIMLNRRGFSTFVMCRSCGKVICCKDCGLPLVYHRNGMLLCHHCDLHFAVPNVCPKCGSRYIKYFGSGTEKLEEELKTLVPKARVIRMDRDTTTTKFAHQEILEAFRRHAYDILLGTQMVAKGHDIPNVTAVGVISADASLGMPDFRAAERCFTLITQTAGRAGRYGTRGKVIIQTYNPAHYAVTKGIAQDYEGFFQKEIKLRKELFYPPFSRLIKLLYQSTDEARAKENAQKLIRVFRTRFPKGREEGEEIIGPAPALIAKLRDIYRFVVLIKTAHIEAVQSLLREQNLHLDTQVTIDIDPVKIL